MTAGRGTTRAVRPVPLTPEAFARFGDVVRHAGTDRRRPFPGALEHRPEAGETGFWVSRIEVPSTLPLAVAVLERHPFTAQTFLPLSVRRYLVVVAEPDGAGGPDPATLQAFIGEAGQGVTYHRDTWHGGMAVLDGPGEFAVLMHVTGRGDDDVFVDLAAPVIVDAADGR